MLLLITYDVETVTPAGRKRLRQVARQCQRYGQRVQNSVFECVVDATQAKQLKLRLVDLIDKQSDSLRFYYLGDDWRRRVEHEGAKPSIDVEGLLIA